METKEVSRQKISDYEAVANFYLQSDQVELTGHQERIRKRYLVIKSMLLQGKSQLHIVNTLRKRYEISETTAYRYIKNVKLIFGELSQADKVFERHFIYEKCKETYRLAKMNNDIKQMSVALANMIKLFPTEEVDLPDFSKLEPNVYPIILDDAVRDLLMQMMQTPGKTDLTELMNQLGNVEDAEHEEVVS